jgi:DNA polymerase I-like protein with 3'-5' exonuclease and polymerase domains
MRFLTNLPTKDREEAIKILLEQRDKVALDIETVSLENTLPLGMGIAVTDTVGFYFFNPRDELITKLFEQTPTLIVFNASFDIPIVRKLGHPVNNYEDAMLLAYGCGMLEGSLEALSTNFLHLPYTSVTSQWKKKDQGNIGIDHAKMGGWCMQHAINTYNVWEKLPKTDLYKEIDKPCVELVLEMEKWELLIDQYRLTLVEQETMVKVLKLEAEIKDELGKPDINLASNPQVAEALQQMGIIGTRKTKAAKDSVSDESLAPLNLPITNKILKHRSLMKTISTYVPAFRKVDDRGRLRTSFGYTNTGRWKSRKPNLQNITRDEKFSEEE